MEIIVYCFLFYVLCEKPRVFLSNNSVLTDESKELKKKNLYTLGNDKRKRSLYKFALNAYVNI